VFIKSALCVLVGSVVGCNSVYAQNASDFFNFFGGVAQTFIIQTTLAEWKKLPQSELSCVDQTLRQQGSNLQEAIREGVPPSDPRIADIRSACKQSTVQDNSSDTSIYYVANTRPPDAYLSLRANPTTSDGQRITTMPNGTLLRVLKRQDDEWWYVKVVPFGPEGWALSHIGNRTFIACCTTAAAVQAPAPSQQELHVAPSFDCSKATYADERAICSSTELSKLDNAVVAGYEYVRQKHGNQYAKSINAPLFQARRACASDVACIKERQNAALKTFEGLGAPIYVPQSVQTEQLLWDHNRSTVYLVAKGRSRKFFYKEPRPGIVSAGARPDSMIFEGEVIGDDEGYQGTAYLFNSRCGRLPYKVSGPILDQSRRVELRGQAPRVDNNCRPIGFIDDTLVFQLIEPPVSPPIAESNPTQTPSAPTTPQSPTSDPEREKLLSEARTHGFDTIEEYQTRLKNARDHGYDSIEDYQKFLRDKQEADLDKDKRDREDYEKRWQKAVLLQSDEKYVSLVNRCIKGPYPSVLSRDSSSIGERRELKRKAFLHCRYFAADLAFNDISNSTQPSITSQLSNIIDTGQIGTEARAYIETSIKACEKNIPRDVLDKWKQEIKTATE
jgi:hypothetical protein